MGSARRVAIVTGAGGGIGRAVATRLAADGMAVVVNDYGVTVDGREPNRTAADEVVAEIVAAGGEAIAHYGSVADFRTGEELVATAVRQYGTLDLLVTCHGILRERMIFNMSEDEWDSVLAVHLKGTFNCVRFATAQMRAQRSGSIVLVTSAAGLEGSPAQANYSAAKLGIVGLAYSSALAMGRYGVNVNCVSPVAATRMTARLTGAMAQTRQASERADAGLVAELVRALGDPELRAITGQVYTASGRRLARWSNPAEVAEVTLADGWGPPEVTGALTQRLGTKPLRRFGALGLAQPGGTSPAQPSGGRQVGETRPASGDAVIARVEHGVMVLTMNDPDRRNPVTDEVRSLLSEHLRTAADDPAVRCVMITGAGRAFSSGGDVSKMGSRTPVGTFTHLTHVRGAVEAMVATPKPVVAAVNGAAVGAGLALALACDIVVAAESAKFGLVFSRRGLVPDSGAAYFLARQIGPYRTKRLAFTGELFGPQEAAAWGLVSKVWPDDEFGPAAERYCRELAEGPTVALGLTKHLVDQATAVDLATTLQMESFAQSVAATTQDHREGVTAFRERRAAEFHGS